MSSFNLIVSITYAILNILIAICLIVLIVSIFRVIGLKKFLSFMKRFWFLVVFSLCGGILGFIITTDKIVGKIIVGVLLALVALGVGAIIWSICNALMKRFNKKAVNILLTLVEVIFCVLLLAFALTRTYGKYHKADPVYYYYDKYGKKHYSEKERDNANFKYDAYKAADEYRKSHPSAK